MKQQLTASFHDFAVSLGQEARSEQSWVRFLHGDLEGEAGIDRVQLERDRRDSRQKARQATEDFRDLVNTRVDWLADRIRCLSKPEPRIISEFDIAARNYRMCATFQHFLDDDRRPESVFEKDWKREREALKALIEVVKRLADLPHPPRASWRQSAEDWRDLLGGADPIPSQGRA